MYVDDALLGLLIRLSELHEDMAGKWFLEVGFGLDIYPTEAPLFATLEGAGEWLGEKVRTTGAIADNEPS